MGLIAAPARKPVEETSALPPGVIQADVDGRRVRLKAADEIVLECGKTQNVLPNTMYDFGYRYLQDQSGAINCIVTWATDTACQGTLSRFFIQSGSATGTWAPAAGAATSDPGTISAQILCSVAGNVNIDQVYLNTVISGF